MLVVSRFVQGIGGALTSAVILGMIVTMFPEPREQAKAIGVYSFVASAGGSIGLLAGGALTQAINWHWIFFVNLPIALVTGLLAVRVLARDKGLGIGQGADVPGALLIVSSLLIGVYTIVEASNYGWGSAHTPGFSAKLNLRFGPKATLLPGLVSIGLGLGYLSQISAGGSYVADVLPAMVLVGIGAGLSFPSLMSLAMSGVDPQEAGLASGMVNTTLQVGGALGLAVLATMSTNRTGDLLASGDSAAQALTSGYRLAFAIGAGLVALAIAIAATVLQRAPSPAMHEAGSPDEVPSPPSPPRRPSSDRK